MQKENVPSLFTAGVALVLQVFAFVLLGIGTIQGALGSAANATICIAGGLFTLLLVHLDKFEEIAGLGLKAKLRETLNEAEQIKANLRAISVLLVRQSLLSMVTVTHEPDGGLAKALQLYREIGSTLVALGVSESATKLMLEQIRLEQVNKRPRSLLKSWQIIGIGTGGYGLERPAADALYNKAVEFARTEPTEWTAIDIERMKSEAAATGLPEHHPALKAWDKAAADMNLSAAAFDRIKFG